MTGSDGSSSSSPIRPTHRHLPSLQTSATPPLELQPSQHHGALSAPPKRQVLPQHQAHIPPLLLTVRFSTSVPDVLLDIPHPATTTIAALKYQIRSHLAQPDSQRRLRFIHGGRILPDTAIVAAVLKPLAPPPPSIQQDDPKGKGKAVEGTSSLAAAQRVYVNCSIGDLLTDAELDDEKQRAEEPVPEAALPSASSFAGHAPAGSGAGAGGYRTTDRGPSGFDRLLGSGFTPAEVNQLRLQYRARQEARYTADTLPSPNSLLRMEDVWLDSNHAPEAGGANVIGDDGDEGGLAAILDVAFKGMLIGFVWPLGAVGWLIRGEEKLPKRMRVMVWCGFALSLLLGTIRYLG